MNLQIGAQGFQLRLATQAAGADAGVLAQRFDAGEGHRAEHVARILALGDGGNLEGGVQRGGQVFQAVHREIYAIFEEGFFNFLGEHALGADLGERDLGDFVAGGLDDLELDGVPLGTEEIGNMMCLPQRKLGTARANAEAGHQFCAPESPLDLEAAASFSLSWRLKRRRTSSTTVVDSGSRAAVFRVLMGVCMILLMMPRVRVSTAISCSGVIGPRRPRTRSISACRMVSRWSCRETIVGTTSRVCRRAWKRTTSLSTISAARSASFLRSATWEDTACCRSSMSYTKIPSTLFIPASTS